MASLKDISKVCGVSVATVSKALNNHTDIGEETRAHIKKVAKEMGYSPNLSARALKTNRTHGIGVLFVDEATNGLTHDHFAAVLDSFKRTAERSGYDITFINCYRDREDRMTYLEHSRYRGFDGVMLACIDFGDPEVVELVQSDIPVVTIDHIFNNRIAVLSDNVTGIRDLLELIYHKGHRKIAYIHGADSAVTKNRVSSFYRTAEMLGLEFVPEGAKPLPKGYNIAAKKFGLPKDKICAVGDQIFTDILGANLAGIRSIFVYPMEFESSLPFRIKRFIERPLLPKEYK